VDDDASTEGMPVAWAWSRRALGTVAVLLALLALWQALASLHLFPPYALPAPGAVLAQARSLLTVGYGGESLWADIGVSTLRIALGFVAAVVVGIPIGIGMASSEAIFQAVDPLLQFARPVPPLAYIPLLVAWFGIGELPKVLVILLGTLPVVIISTMSGVRSAPRQWRQVAECLGATPIQTFWHVVLPASLPEVFTGMRVGIGVAWTCLVAAEIIAANAGLGWLVQYAGQEVQIGIIFVGIMAIGLLGYLMELAIRLIEHLAVPWKGHGQV
jgi:ABC-type nitrate/sulfonate/bicarbonate transport system permease component